MDKNDTIVTNIVIQALKMDDTIKRQEVLIEQLESEKKELIIIISRMKSMLIKYAPESMSQLNLFGL